MAIHRRTDKNGYLVYTNSVTGRTALVDEDDLAAIADTAKAWYGRDDVACRRLLDGDLSFRNLQAIHAVLIHARTTADEGDLGIDDDDYLDLATSIEDLEGILRRIRLLD